MIQVISFKIDDWKKASEFCWSHYQQLAKDGLKFVGTTKPRIVIRYSDVIPGSDEETLQGLQFSLNSAKSMLIDYEQQLREHTAIQPTFKTNEKGWDEAEVQIKSSKKMIELQKIKISVIEQMIEEII